MNEQFSELTWDWKWRSGFMKLRWRENISLAGAGPAWCCFGSESDLSWDVDNVGRVPSGQTDHMTGLPTSLHRHILSQVTCWSRYWIIQTLGHPVNQLTVHLRCESDEDTLHEKLLSCYSDLIWVRARPWLSQHTMGRFSKVRLACGSSHQLSPISLPTIQF